MSYSGSGLGGLTMEKDASNNRLMGVRGSVELKSINSVGGNNNNLSGGQNGFAWTTSSKHQSSKSG
jgi:hypothetical protein